MEAMRNQIQALTEELNTLRLEVVQTKSSHASLHQSTVEMSTGTARQFSELGEKFAKLENNMQVWKPEVGPAGADSRRSP